MRQVLNLRFVMAFKSGRFFKDVDRLVANGLIPNMEKITNKGTLVRRASSHLRHGVDRHSL